MPGIPWEVAEHALCLIPGFDDERRRAIDKEIAKLLAARFIRVVFHSN